MILWEMFQGKVSYRKVDVWSEFVLKQNGIWNGGCECTCWPVC